MSDHHKPLSKPASIPAEAEAQEYVRFWLANNADHVNVYVGNAGDPEKEPAMWGFILADIAKQVTKRAFPEEDKSDAEKKAEEEAEDDELPTINPDPPDLGD